VFYANCCYAELCYCVAQNFSMQSVSHRQQRIDRLLINTAHLPYYVASHHSDMAPQTGAKNWFYSTFYYITLNSNCEAKRVSKKLKIIQQDRVKRLHECFGLKCLPL